MAVCEVCGNDYEMAIDVIAAGVRHTFDCFECAAHALAPICENCRCKVLGHGVEVGRQFFCSPHCARAATRADLRGSAA